MKAKLSYTEGNTYGSIVLIPEGAEDVGMFRTLLASDAARMTQCALTYEYNTPEVRLFFQCIGSKD